MDIVNVVRRLARGDISYALGRFRTVRRVYSKAMSFSSRPPAVEQSELTSNAILYPSGSDDDLIALLNRDALVGDIFLRPEDVLEIRRFAETATLYTQGWHRAFERSDVVGSRLPDGEICPLGHVRNPTRCPAIRNIRNDRRLLGLMRRYLGYMPSDIDVRLYWSFVGDIADAERERRGQTVIYHYDVSGFNFTYAMFYITDCDARSGAHVAVPGSHRRKPLKSLLHSARHSDEEVRGIYGGASERVITGPGGTGLIEDPSCFHKALAPVDTERLALQLRFS